MSLTVISKAEEEKKAIREALAAVPFEYKPRDELDKSIINLFSGVESTMKGEVEYEIPIMDNIGISDSHTYRMLLVGLFNEASLTRNEILAIFALFSHMSNATRVRKTLLQKEEDWKKNSWYKGVKDFVDKYVVTYTKQETDSKKIAGHHITNANPSLAALMWLISSSKPMRTYKEFISHTWSAQLNVTKDVKEDCLNFEKKLWGESIKRSRGGNFEDFGFNMTYFNTKSQDMYPFLATPIFPFKEAFDRNQVAKYVDMDFVKVARFSLSLMANSLADTAEKKAIEKKETDLLSEQKSETDPKKRRDIADKLKDVRKEKAILLKTNAPVLSEVTDVLISTIYTDWEKEDKERVSAVSSSAAATPSSNASSLNLTSSSSSNTSLREDLRRREKALEDLRKGEE